MSLIKAILHQLGLSVTPANNFTLDASADNGTMKLARGNAGATTQDVMTVAADGKVAFPQGLVAPPVAGEVLQVLYSEDAGANTQSGSFVNVSIAVKSIAPKSANSKIIVECYWQGGVGSLSGVNTVGVYQLYQGSVSGLFGYSSSVSASNSAGGNGIQSRQHLMAEYPNADLAVKSFGLAAALNTGPGVNVFGTSQTWRITEVQQ